MQRRQILVGFLLMGLSGVAIAQTSTPQAKPHRMEIFRPGASAIQIQSGSARVDGPVTQLGGWVQLKVDGNVIVADEATVNLRGGDIQLRGDVRFILK